MQLGVMCMIGIHIRRSYLIAILSVSRAIDDLDLN